MTTCYVKVTPDADTFTVDISGTYPRVTVPEPAENGRANEFLRERLSRVLDADVGIVSGHRSRRKEIAVDLPRSEIDRRLSEV
ncbi:MAG: DUF167 domain-containing protein [Candidatus Nanohaloarchaea archaeon]